MKEIEIPVITGNITNPFIRVDNQEINANLISIKNKDANEISLSKNELIYLYNLYNQNRFNPYEKCLIECIINKRDTMKDLAYIFDCNIDEITDNFFELQKSPKKYVVLLDDFNVDDFNIEKFRLKYVSGSLYGDFDKNHIDIFSELEIVGSYIDLYPSNSYFNLNKLRYVGGNFFINNVSNSKSLTKLEYIGGDAYLDEFKETITYQTYR